MTNEAISNDMLLHSSEAAKLLKSISNEQRLLILCILHERELSVGDLNNMMPKLSQSALSQHLAVLRNEKIVATRRDSQTIYYSLASDHVTKIIHLLHDMYCSSY